MIYGELSKDVSLRLSKTKILLSDLLDPSVTWIASTSEAKSLVGIRNRLDFNLNLTIGIWEKVSSTHHSYFAQSYAFSEASYEETLKGGLGRSHTFVSAARARWGRSVPGPIYCWLVDIHARALRAQLRSLPLVSDEVRWVRALDKRSPFPAFGKGSRITYGEYRKLVAIARQKGMGTAIKTRPIELAADWNRYWREDEIGHKDDNTSYSKPPKADRNRADFGTITGSPSCDGATGNLGA